MDYLVDAWVRHTAPFVGDLWQSVTFWRTVGLGALTLIVLLYCGRKRLAGLLSKDRTAEHDLRVFGESDAILTERCLLNVLDDFDYDHSFRDSSRRLLGDFRAYFDECGHQYLDRTLQARADELRESLNKLTQFTGLHFFWYPEDQPMESDIRYCMHPQLNCDRAGNGSTEQGEKYDCLAEELDTLVGNVRSGYVEYRTAVKRALMI